MTPCFLPLSGLPSLAWSGQSYGQSMAAPPSPINNLSQAERREREKGKRKVSAESPFSLGLNNYKKKTQQISTQISSVRTKHGYQAKSIFNREDCFPNKTVVLLIKKGGGADVGQAEALSSMSHSVLLSLHPLPGRWQTQSMIGASESQLFYSKASSPPVSLLVGN